MLVCARVEQLTPPQSCHMLTDAEGMSQGLTCLICPQLEKIVSNPGLGGFFFFLKARYKLNFGVFSL